MEIPSYIAIAFTNDMDISDLHQLKPMVLPRHDLVKTEQSSCERRRLTPRAAGERSIHQLPKCPRRRPSACSLLDTYGEESPVVEHQSNDLFKKKEAPPSLPRRLPSQNILAIGEEEDGEEEEKLELDLHSCSSWTFDAEETREIYRTLSMVSTDSKEDLIPSLPRRRKSINKQMFHSTRPSGRMSANAA